jgi:hypothetical protein
VTSNGEELLSLHLHPFQVCACPPGPLACVRGLLKFRCRFFYCACAVVFFVRFPLPRIPSVVPIFRKRAPGRLHGASGGWSSPLSVFVWLTQRGASRPSPKCVVEHVLCCGAGERAARSAAEECGARHGGPCQPLGREDKHRSAQSAPAELAAVLGRPGPTYVQHGARRPHALCALPDRVRRAVRAAPLFVLSAHHCLRCWPFVVARHQARPCSCCCNSRRAQAWWCGAPRWPVPRL